METKDETFNGWTNKPTWLVKLWLDNDEGIHNGILELVKDNKNLEDYKIGEVLSNWVDLNMLMAYNGTLQNDLLGWVMDCVNWSEIVKSFKEELE